MNTAVEKFLMRAVAPLVIRWLRDRGYLSSAKALILDLGLDIKAFFEDIEVHHAASEFPNYDPPKTVIPQHPQPATPKKSTFLGLESENSYPK